MKNSPQGNRVRAARHYRKKKEFIANWKKDGCVLCGEKDIVVLDAHHVDESSKHPMLKNAKRQRLQLSELGWERLYEELEKCIVLCANCHRRETHRRRLLKEAI